MDLKQEMLALELRHKRLDYEVQYLERRAFLTPHEQRRIQDLKKRKLITKDRLYEVRRHLE